MMNIVVDFHTEEGSDFLSIFEGRKSSGFSRLARLHGNLTGEYVNMFHSRFWHTTLSPTVVYVGHYGLC